MNDQKFQQLVLQRLDKIDESLKALNMSAPPTDPIGPPAEHPLTFPDIDPPQGIEYRNGISEPDARNVVRLEQYDKDDELRAQAKAYRQRYGADAFGPLFVVGPEELKEAWPDAKVNDALKLDTELAGTLLNQGRHYKIGMNVQPSVTRFKANAERGAEGREPVFQEFRERMQRDLDATAEPKVG